MTTSRPAPWVAHEPPGGHELPSLRVVLAGHLPRKEDGIDTVFEHWAVGLVLSGRGQFQVQGGSVMPMAAPCVFYIAPGLRYTYGPEPGSCWEERFVAVQGARCAEWVAAGWIQEAGRPLSLTGTDLLGLVELHEEAGRALRAGSVRIGLAKVLFEQWVWRLRHAAGAAAEPHPVEALAETWRVRPVAHADLARAARDLGLSYSHFRAVFRERLGISPARFLLRQRISLACRLLSEGLPVKQVAAKTGFPHLAGFYRAFASTTGTAPSRYQREARRLVSGEGGLRGASPRN